MDTRTGMRDVGQESLRRRAGLFNRLGVNGHGDYYPSAQVAGSQYPNPSNEQRRSLLYNRLGLDNRGQRFNSPIASNNTPTFQQGDNDYGYDPGNTRNTGYSIEDLRTFAKEDRDDSFKQANQLADKSALYQSLHSLSDNLFGRKQPNQNLANMTEQYVANNKSDWRYW